MTPQERDSLILSLQQVVYINARRVLFSTGRQVPFEELISAGWVGAIKAVDAFEPERGLLLKTLADHKIRGAILDYLREIDSLGRKHRRLVKSGELEAPRLCELAPGGSDHPRATDWQKQVEARLDVDKLLLVARLPAKSRILVERLDLQGGSQTKLAKELKIHPSRVSQLRTEALAALRAAA
jgi:RNA polymerase sigma factor (sigma-70 family)